MDWKELHERLDWLKLKPLGEEEENDLLMKLYVASFSVIGMMKNIGDSKRLLTMADYYIDKLGIHMDGYEQVPELEIEPNGLLLRRKDAINLNRKKLIDIIHMLGFIDDNWEDHLLASGIVGSYLRRRWDRFSVSDSIDAMEGDAFYYLLSTLDSRQAANYSQSTGNLVTYGNAAWERWQKRGSKVTLLNERIALLDGFGEFTQWEMAEILSTRQSTVSRSNYMQEKRQRHHYEVNVEYHSGMTQPKVELSMLMEAV